MFVLYNQGMVWAGRDLKISSSRPCCGQGCQPRCQAARRARFRGVGLEQNSPFDPSWHFPRQVLQPSPPTFAPWHPSGLWRQMLLEHSVRLCLRGRNPSAGSWDSASLGAGLWKEPRRRMWRGELVPHLQHPQRGAKRLLGKADRSRSFKGWSVCSQVWGAAPRTGAHKGRAGREPGALWC